MTSSEIISDPHATPDTRWVAFVRGEDRTGTLTALASVFSSRGVNFESIATGDLHAASGLIVIVFTTSDRIQRLLARTVERLAAIQSVSVHQANDPNVRAVGVVRAPESVSVDSLFDDAVRWSNFEGSGPAFVEGDLVSVETALALARLAGAVTLATVILPPQTERNSSVAATAGRIH